MAGLPRRLDQGDCTQAGEPARPRQARIGPEIERTGGSRLCRPVQVASEESKRASRVADAARSAQTCSRHLCGVEVLFWSRDDVVRIDPPMGLSQLFGLTLPWCSPYLADSARCRLMLAASGAGRGTGACKAQRELTTSSARP